MSRRSKQSESGLDVTGDTTTPAIGNPYGAEAHVALDKCQTAGMPEEVEAKLSSIQNLDWTKVWTLVSKLQAAPYNLTLDKLWAIIFEVYHTFFGDPTPTQDPNAPIVG